METIMDEQRQTELQERKDQLRGFPRCNFVHLLWCDISGVRRSRVTPYSRLIDAAMKGIGVTRNCMGMTSFFDGATPDTGLDQVGEIRLWADLGTARPQPWRLTNQTVLANMVTDRGQPWECCPRGALRRTLQLLQMQFGITMEVGCETEFYLLQGDPQAIGKQLQGGGQLLFPLDESKYSQSSSINAASEDVEAIVLAIQTLAGVTVEQFHAEAGGGQFEIVTGHKPAMDAADALVLTREAIVATAARQGHPATLLPHPFSGRPSSGAHIHFSIFKDGENLLCGGSREAGLTELGDNFLSGILGHLPGIMSFLAATPNSYRRLQPSSWTGAFQIWGVNNKEAALRLIPGTNMSTNCEIKTPDATSNPHLAIAAIATAGLLGLRRGGLLPESLSVDPATLTKEERQNEGIRQLPSSLQAALDTLNIDKDLVAGLKETLGAPLLQAHIAVKRAEVKRWSQANDHNLEVQELWARY
mmetsp:Transcript_12380/g.37258  ORF Transcript_12380/g.37258 Transcript_12380/m.37258 type:complete len:474 (+) Transcript_12380:115-1536(+)